LGAGDSKLLAALGVWIPLKALMPFVFFMGVSGALLSFAALYIMRKRVLKSYREKSIWIERLHSGKGVVPYGIAIGLGFLGVMAKGLI